MWQEKENDVLMVLVIYGNFSVILAKACLLLKPLCSVPASHTQSPQIFIISKNDLQKTIVVNKFECIKISHI